MQDCHGSSTGNGAPIQDDTQNYNIISGSQNGTHTQVEFSRELETCDPHDVQIGVSKIHSYTQLVGFTQHEAGIFMPPLEILLYKNPRAQQ